MKKPTRRELELENARMRGKLEALEQILEARRPPPPAQKPGEVLIPFLPPGPSVQAAGAIPHDGRTCPSACQGPHAIFVDGVPWHGTVSEITIGGPQRPASDIIIGSTCGASS